MQRAAEREHMRALREAERAQRAYERSVAMEEKERRRLYVESRVADVAAMNEQLTATVEALQTCSSTPLTSMTSSTSMLSRRRPSYHRFSPARSRRSNWLPSRRRSCRRP